MHRLSTATRGLRVSQIGPCSLNSQAHAPTLVTCKGEELECESKACRKLAQCNDIIDNIMSNASKTRKLRPKSKAFADKLLNNPKITLTQAYLDTHETTNRDVARVEGSNLARSPAVMKYLEAHSEQAEHRIVELMQQNEDKRLAFDASRDILDRKHGKATQRTEVQTMGISLNIDLTQALTENSY